EGVGLEVEEVGAEEVARHQVRRELDALEVQLQAGGEAARQQGLAGAGRTLEEQMPLGDQGDHEEMDRLLLADDDAADPLPQGLAQLNDFLDCHSSSPRAID